ncbi:MAG: cyclase family protein [Anaerolineales bacterium]|nr:cyclase family protein [Anaerolineales bacterium]
MIYDISRTISPTLKVWPGDEPFSYQPVLKLSEGASVNLMTLTMSAHTGTHADAPFHHEPVNIHPSALDITTYIGPAHVVSIERQHGGIVPEDFAHADLTGVKRLLVHTWVSDLPDDEWSQDFPYPTPAFIEWMAELGIILLGVDMPSVDRFDDPTLQCHHLLYKHNIRNIETMCLRGVPDGVYELIALPLKVDHVCGSPLRAILRTLD